LHDASVFWAERNLLLWDVYWPRKAFLKVVTPSREELRVGHDKTLNVQVRAYRTLVFDRHARGGWRPATWQDLMDRRDLLAEAPADVPGDWKDAARDAEFGLTVDDVEVRLDKFPVRVQVAAGSLPAKWCIVDRKAAGGLRPLRWSDLTAERLGGVAP